MNKKRKSKSKIKLIVIILAVLLAAGAACYFILGKDKVNKIVDKAKEKTSGKKKEEEPQIKAVNLNSTKRPFAIMINNLHPARQMHSGLQDAYIIYEMIVEGGITRYLAVFESDKNIDDANFRIGPVRSSRHYYLDYVLENDAIYVHNGYSPQAGEDFVKLGIDRISAEAPKTGYRENPLKLAREHTLFVSTKLLNENGIGKKRTELKKDEKVNRYRLLKYSVKEVNLDSKEGAIVANKVKIPYSNSYRTSYEYDPENKVYKRYVNEKEHKDYRTKNQYTFKNIITYKVANNNIKSPDGYNGRQELHNIGSGEGYYITNGYAVPIKWEKTDRKSKTIYTYLDGTEIEVNDGNTFIQIQPSGKELTIE